MADLWKAVLFGLVEGITEWLPISSTGHMILLNELIRLDVSDAFFEMFLVVIQLGAILAVVALYGRRLVPVRFHPGPALDWEKMQMWGRIIVASVPAGVVGILWDDVFLRMFYNDQTVAVMLIVVGIVFLLVERRLAGKRVAQDSVADISIGDAFFIGVFQMLAAVFPGTSRSGATIIAALLLGISRTTAAEFTFFLAVPAMLGASAVKMAKFGMDFTGNELTVLAVGMAAAFLVSVLAIRFLMAYIRRHDFRMFGWYRIVLGILVAGYFTVAK